MYAMEECPSKSAKDCGKSNESKTVCWWGKCESNVECSKIIYVDSKGILRKWCVYSIKVAKPILLGETEYKSNGGKKVTIEL